MNYMILARPHLPPRVDHSVGDCTLGENIVIIHGGGCNQAISGLVTRGKDGCSPWHPTGPAICQVNLLKGWEWRLGTSVLGIAIDLQAIKVKGTQSSIKGTHTNSTNSVIQVSVTAYSMKLAALNKKTHQLMWEYVVKSKALPRPHLKHNARSRSQSAMSHYVTLPLTYGIS